MLDRQPTFGILVPVVEYSGIGLASKDATPNVKRFLVILPPSYERRHARKR
jgi:hypothetical protein